VEGIIIECCLLVDGWVIHQQQMVDNQVLIFVSQRNNPVKLYCPSMFVGRSRQKLILIIGIRLEYISQKSENLGYDIL